MKKILILGLTAAVLAGPSVAQTVGAPRTIRLAPQDAWMRQQEATAGLVFHAPGAGDFDVFDFAYGVEFGYRRWLTDVFGVGVGLGVETWTAGGGGNWSGAADGDMLVVPLTLSGHMRAADFGWGGLQLFAALEYDFTSSDVTLERGGRRDTVDVDNCLNGLIGIDLTVPLNETLSLGARLGYQATLVEAGASAFGGNLRDLDMQSVFFGLGVSMAF